MEFTPHEPLDHATLSEWALGEKQYVALLHAVDQITNTLKSGLLGGTITRDQLHTTGVVVRLDPVFGKDGRENGMLVNALHFRLNGMVALTYVGKAEEWGVNFHVKTYS